MLKKTSKNNTILSNFNIIKELGHGMYGTVYLILFTKNKSEYALKIEHIEKKDIKPNKKSQIWREINFYMSYGNEHPEKFIRLIEFDFISNCTHKQVYSQDLKLFSIEIQNKIEKINSSNYCVRKVYTLVQGVLSDIIHKLNTKQIYSMIIQIIKITDDLHSNNFVHGDIHSRNIGWEKTTKKNIQIINIPIKTFGYNYKLIDFGLVMKESDAMNKKEEHIFNNLKYTEIYNIIYMMVNTEMFDIANKLHIMYNLHDVYIKFKKKYIKEYNSIKKISLDKQMQLFLFDIMYPEKFQIIIFGEKFQKIIPRILYIPLNDIIYFVKNYTDINLLINYFNNKIL